ncbi:MAG: hypothetical protein RJA59_1171 [Pseudomonadota bacterium]
MNRETITAALWTRISGISGVRTAERRLRHFSEVSPSEMPAIFLGVDNATANQERGRKASWDLKFSVYVYCHEAAAIGPSSALNTIVDAIDAALQITSAEFKPGQTFGPTTLGGLVSHAWMTTVETDEGSLGDLGVAVCSIEVLAT